MNLKYNSLNPYCEPNLAKRGLYPRIGGLIRQRIAGYDKADDKLDMIRWLMFYSDGRTSLSEISEKTGFSFERLHEVAEELRQYRLLEIVEDTKGLH